MSYAEYLPNLSTSEDELYRTNLSQRCVEKVGDVETRCAQACACADKTCKRACSGCKGETAQRLRLCKQIGQPPKASARAPRSKTRSTKSSSRP